MAKEIAMPSFSFLGLTKNCHEQIQDFQVSMNCLRKKSSNLTKILEKLNQPL